MYKCSVVKCENGWYHACSRHFSLDSHCKSHEKCMDLTRIHCVFVHLSECVTKKRTKWRAFWMYKFDFFFRAQNALNRKKKMVQWREKKGLFIIWIPKIPRCFAFALDPFYELYLHFKTKIFHYTLFRSFKFSVKIESFFLLGIFYSKSVCIYFRMRNTIWLSFVFFF